MTIKPPCLQTFVADAAQAGAGPLPSRLVEVSTEDCTPSQCFDINPDLSSLAASVQTHSGGNWLSASDPTRNTLPPFYPRYDGTDYVASVLRTPRTDFVPLVLYHFEDLPYEDIAKKLGVSLAKVKTDILRARTALAAIIARSGASHETFSA